MVYPRGTEVCRKAAARGDLDFLKYAHENGCPWDEWTCNAAAGVGHLGCSKYAHENGCPEEGGRGANEDLESLDGVLLRSRGRQAGVREDDADPE